MKNTAEILFQIPKFAIYGGVMIIFDLASINTTNKKQEGSFQFPNRILLKRITCTMVLIKSCYILWCNITGCSTHRLPELKKTPKNRHRQTSSTDPSTEDLSQCHHWVFGRTLCCAIKGKTIAMNQDWVNNHAYRLSYNVFVLYVFYT